MAILFKCDDSDAAPWMSALRDAMPSREIRLFPEVGERADIAYALVHAPPPELLASLPNLRAVFSLWAGIDHLASDPALPDVPIVRMVERGMTGSMTEYVVLQVLDRHRHGPQYRARQNEREWRPIVPPPAWRRRVGVLGLGTLGASAAHALAALGFDVAGWSRTLKQLDGIRTYHGAAGLQVLLNRTEILVCLLPLTDATRGIVNRDTIGRLPDGAYLINCARGAHVVETDLLEALDSGKLAGATLDVFDTEPLPRDHPFWSHPRVTVTPHIAAWTVIETAVESVAENIARIEAGLPPRNVLDRGLGY